MASQLRRLREVLDALQSLTEAPASPTPRPSSISVRVPFARSGTHYTCGIASLQSVLHYYGVEEIESELAKVLDSHEVRGTNYHRMVEYLRSKRLHVRVREGMTLEELRTRVRMGTPVIVAFQAWGRKGTNYSETRAHGHYAVVVGADENFVYFMDPSIMSNYAFLPVEDFLERWHDEYEEKGKKVEVLHLGFSIEGEPEFDADDLVPVE